MKYYEVISKRSKELLKVYRISEDGSIHFYDNCDNPLWMKSWYPAEEFLLYWEEQGYIVNEISEGKALAPCMLKELLV